MPDVLKIAMERREALVKEVKALDKFIGMANELLARAGDKGAPAPSKPKTTLKPAPLPPRAAAEATQAGDAATSGSRTEAFLKSHMADPGATPAKAG